MVRFQQHTGFPWNPESFRSDPNWYIPLPLMISEDVDLRDAEYGVSPILLRYSGVPVTCERRPEAATEAAPKLQWPRCSIQRKDVSLCPFALFLYVTVYQFFEKGELEAENSISL